MVKCRITSKNLLLVNNQIESRERSVSCGLLFKWFMNKDIKNVKFLLKTY